MWFRLTGNERLGRCATDRCGGQPTSRFEGGGVGSNYCSGCRAKIEGICDHIPMKAALDDELGCIRCGEWLGKAN